jgi:hypothetical protein
MLKHKMARSFLQIAALSIVGLFLTAAPAKANYEFDCTQKAADCTAKCGETVYWTLVYQFWDEWVGDWDYVYNYSYGSGIQDFECDEQAQTEYCACTY